MVFYYTTKASKKNHNEKRRFTLVKKKNKINLYEHGIFSPQWFFKFTLERGVQVMPQSQSPCFSLPWPA